MENFIYQGEDFNLVLKVFDKQKPINEEILNQWNIGIIIYTNKFQPILLSTAEEFGNKTVETGLIKLEKSGNVLKAKIPSTQTCNLNAGYACLEIKIKFPDSWRTIQKENKIFQVKPSSIKSLEF